MQQDGVRQFFLYARSVMSVATRLQVDIGRTMKNMVSGQDAKSAFGTDAIEGEVPPNILMFVSSSVAKSAQSIISSVARYLVE